MGANRSDQTDTEADPAGGMRTLPDLLGPGLELVLVGINPSSYAVEVGHYFARPQNRFWPAFSRSRLSLPIRGHLGVERLLPEHDVLLPRFGIGLTDLVKVPSAQAAHLPARSYREWGPRTRDRLQGLGPKVLAFQGKTAFLPFLRHGLGRPVRKVAIGLHPEGWGPIRLYCLPNPSPANARFRLEDFVRAYDELADLLDAGRGR